MVVSPTIFAGSHHVHSARHTGAGEWALVVDDSAVNRKIGAAQLALLGLQVDVAVSGQEAIAKCMSKHYDIVLMDVLMPGMSGFDCARILRRRALHTRRQVILGWCSKATAEDCAEAGLDGFIAKPLDLKSLRAYLRTFSFRYAK